MITKICDRCGAKVDDLKQFKPEWGGYELCIPCWKQHEKIDDEIRHRHLDAMKTEQLQAIHDFVGHKPEPKPVKKSIWQKLWELLKQGVKD